MDAKRAQVSFVLASVIACLLAVCHSVGQESAVADNVANAAALRAKAQAGHAPSQTKLADQLAAASDFTNALVWYRKAADQGEVEAQLALASLHLAGQGIAKNPQEAARWLRVAAAQLEQAKPVPLVPPKPVAATSFSTPPIPSNPSPTNGPTAARIQRVLTVQAVPQQLQDLPQPLQLQRATP